VTLEAWAVGITAGSREVPGRKGLCQETTLIIIIIIIIIKHEIKELLKKQPNCALHTYCGKC
jgi:hypothetical protein